MENKIIKAYKPYKTTLREVARRCGTDHHTVKRVLLKNGIAIEKGKKDPPTQAHRDAISKACKGRKTWSKGKKMSKTSVYKNMATHIRFNVTSDWLSKFTDLNKLKFLNRTITNRSGRFSETTNWYVKYIEKFYTDTQFNNLYDEWILSNHDKYKRPSIDHIIPKARGGNNDLSNLQFLSWFENRSKTDMTQKEWDLLKSKIEEYLI